MRLAFEIARSRASLIAAFFLLPYAGVLIGLDVAAHYGSLTIAELPVQFYLASDRGFGEFLEYSMTGAIAVMTLLLWTYKRALCFSLILAACVAGAAFFGVVVDFLVVWGEQEAASHVLLVFIEDGGEFAMLILAFLFTVGFFDSEYVQSRNAASASANRTYQRMSGGAA